MIDVAAASRHWTVVGYFVPDRPGGAPAACAAVNLTVNHATTTGAVHRPAAGPPAAAAEAAVRAPRPAPRPGADRPGAGGAGHGEAADPGGQLSAISAGPRQRTSG